MLETKIKPNKPPKSGEACSHTLSVASATTIPPFSAFSGTLPCYQGERWVTPVLVSLRFLFALLSSRREESSGWPLSLRKFCCAH